MPAEDITCVAQWSINTYDITFDLAYGGKKIVRSYDYMASVSSENNPERTGYVFSKWDQAIPERMPAMDMTITAIWIANAYTIRFVSNGGDGSMLPMNATYGEGIELTVCSFEKTGYTFSGWTYTSDGSVSLSDGCEVRNLATGVEGDDEVILYAVWSANKYVVTFNSNDGEDREVSRTFTYDSDESLPIGLFTRLGHSFTGWAPSPSGEVIRTDGAKVDNLSTGATIGLYAIWSVNTYRINFVDTGDSVIEDIVALYGSDIIPPNDPVRKGYTFDDWDTDVPVTMPGYDMTITAKWMKNTYSIRFMSNGGIGSISPLVATYDHDVELTVCSFERTGYSFTGWSTSVNGPVSFQDGSKVRNLATGVDGDDIVILHAIWSANSYVVNFNSNYGENEKDSRTFVYDSDESLPKGLFTRVGHTLSGWALEPNGGKIRSDGARVDNLSSGDEVELYAIWSVNTYRIHFIDTGDSTIDDIVGLYGSPITSPGDPICEGHSFAGWDLEIPETMPATNLEIKAKWSVNTYRIHFANTGDSIIHDIVTIYGASITSPDDPVRKGYTFSDWDKWIPSTMPAKDLTIAAVWVANSYSIRFMPNGGNGTMSTMIATYDADTELTECSFKRTGYTFTGWSLSSKGPVSFNDGSNVGNLATGASGDDIVVLYAIWSANTYVVNFNSNDGKGVVESRTFTYDSDESLPEGLFTRVGHTLTGWAIEPLGESVRADGAKADNLSTHDPVELFAVWVVNTYRIQFLNTGDSVIGDIVATYGSEIIHPDHPVYKGHTFTGWDTTIPETMPANGLKIKATWSVNSYTVSFVGCELDSMEVKFGNGLGLVEPTRIGYDFNGWKEDVPDTMPDMDLTFTATWVACKVHVRFHGFDDLELVVDYDSNYGDLPDANRSGYDFRGWYAEESLSTPITGDVKVTNPSDHMLYGHFVKIWTLSLHSDDPEHGSVTGSGVFDEGTLVSFKATANDGFAFIRWTDGDINSERTLRLDSYVELVAVFSKIRTITLVTDTGTDILECPTGEHIDLPDTGSFRKGFEFVGWTDGRQRYPVSSHFVMGESDITLYGMWAPMRYRLTLEFDADDVREFHLYPGESLPEVDVPDVYGKMFVGWDSDHPESMPAEDLHLKAVWVDRFVRYSFDTGDSSKDLSLKVGSDVPDVNDPMKEGYVFEGWNPKVPAVVGTEDLTFVAEWSLGTYSVRYIAFDESQISVVNLPYGERVVPIIDPVRIGYEFKGWSPSIPETMPGHDLTLHAIWEQSLFSIVLDCGDELLTLKGAYGSEVVVPENAMNRDGYDFRGWTMDVPDTFPDHDLTIYAKWEPRTYTVTFDLDDDVVMKVSCGDRLPMIDIPSREGHRFVGWIGWTDTMPAKDVTLIPEWESMTYVATFDPSDGSDMVQMEYHYGDQIDVPAVPEGCIDWYPVVPKTMPSYDISFVAVIGSVPNKNGSVQECLVDEEVMMVHIEDITSDSLRIVNKGAWSILCHTPSLDDAHGYIVASVTPTGTFGEYDIDVHPTYGGMKGRIVVNLPYLGHVGDHVLVRSIDGTGSHTVETVCSEMDGKLFVSIETSPLSRCQILSVMEGPDDPFSVYMYPLMTVGMLTLILALIIWRRSRQ